VVYKKPTLQTEKTWLRLKRWKKNYQVYGHLKEAAMAILISDKVNFKPKLIRRDQGGHFILIKGAIHQEEITIFNRCQVSVHLI
jgi:hypothetical protein